MREVGKGHFVSEVPLSRLLRALLPDIVDRNSAQGNQPDLIPVVQGNSACFRHFLGRESHATHVLDGILRARRDMLLGEAEAIAMLRGLFLALVSRLTLEDLHEPLTDRIVIRFQQFDRGFQRTLRRTIEQIVKYDHGSSSLSVVSDKNEYTTSQPEIIPNCLLFGADNNRTIPLPYYNYGIKLDSRLGILRFSSTSKIYYQKQVLMIFYVCFQNHLCDL